MGKQLLQQKLIDFQREIIGLSQQMRSKQQSYQDSEDHLLLELIQVLDAFENIFKQLETKADGFEKSVRRALKSFHAVQRKITRILAEHGVSQIELADNKVALGLCKVIETRDEQSREEGEVIEIIRHGYQQGERVLRPVEVITVAHHSSNV